MKSCLMFLLGVLWMLQSQAQITVVAFGSLSSSPRKAPLFGLTANAIYNHTFTDPALVDSVANLNPPLLRYPGGTPGNYWDWKKGWPAAPFSTCYPNGPSPSLTFRHDELKIALNKCSADMLYGLNMIHSNLNYQLQGIQYAASLGIPIKYLEFGNEHNLNCDLMSSTTYASMCKLWADTIKSYYPNTKICLVGGDVPGSAPTWIKDINAQNINYDALSFHIYPLPASSNGFNVNKTLASAYQTTGNRFTASHFSNAPQKEVWVTEYNMSIDNTAETNTWTQTLVLFGMLDTMLQLPQITMMLPWAYSGPLVGLQSLDYNNYAMKATGVAVKLLNDISRGADSCVKINFNNVSYQSYQGMKFPRVFGYQFTGAKNNGSFVVNLSSDSIWLDVQTIGPLGAYTIYSADTAQKINNGFQDLIISYWNGGNGIVLPPYAIVTLNYAIQNGWSTESIPEVIYHMAPNPTHDRIRISPFRGAVPYEIYNSQGQAVQSGMAHQDDIDVAGLSAGIYFLSINRQPLQKLVKL